MSRQTRAPQPAGQSRQSQVVNTFGPGALVDLAEHSVIIGGLETWHGQGTLVSEERLLSRLRIDLNIPYLEMRAPPTKPDGDQAPATGIHGFVFPTWFVAQYEEDRWGGTARPLVHLKSLDKGRRYLHDKKPFGVVPIRFVQACVNGHISDIDWRAFVHGPKLDCYRPLWLLERGTSGDIAAVQARCECGVSRMLSSATVVGKAPLGPCGGHRPWLGTGGRELCGGPDGSPAPNRFLVRHATNAWFPLTTSVIHIPDRQAALKRAVDTSWDDGLKNVTTVDQVAMLRTLVPALKAALEGLDGDAVYGEIQRKKGLVPPSNKGLKDLELETLLSREDEVGEEKPDGDFFARRLPLPPAHNGPMALVDRVVLVHRLREVQALVGFTRFEPPAFNLSGELDLPVRTAQLARELRWVPAIENRGEGVLIVLKKEAVDAWALRPEVVRRAEELLAGFTAWQQAEPSRAKAWFPGQRYMMLHSLSHLLMTAMSLECGYAASSIRERIYANPQIGYAILLYTGTPDAEGTLGGLIQVGRKIERHLAQALEIGRLCSYDPVCAQHRPAAIEEDRFLHGAACHGCLLISETSCEQRNLFLDRALVVPTVDVADAAFFGDPA
jgi:hypothetical protein